MPQNITDSLTFTSPIVAPADGDLRNAASVKTAIQGLSNRTAFLDNIVETLGVKVVRTVANTAALHALVVPTDAVEIALVYDDDTFGLYVWVPGSTAPVIAGFVEPTTTLVTGRWHSLLSYLVTLGGASGTARRMSADILPVPNRLVSLTQVLETTPTSRQLVNQTAYTDFGLNSNEVALQVGDKVKVTFTGTFVEDTGENSFCRIVSNDGSTDTALPGASFFCGVVGSSGGCVVPLNLVGYHEVSVAGNYTYKLQGKGTGSNTIQVYQPRQAIVEIVRP